MSQNGNLPRIRGENKTFETTTKFLGIPMFNYIMVWVGGLDFWDLFMKGIVNQGHP